MRGPSNGLATGPMIMVDLVSIAMVGRPFRAGPAPDGQCPWWVNINDDR